MKVSEYLKQAGNNIFQGVTGSLACTALTAYGVAASVASIVTGGKFKSINNQANKFTFLSQGLVAGFYQAAVKVLNPSHKFAKGSSGFITDAVAAPIFKVAKALSMVDHKPVVRELASRVTYLVGTAVHVATRVCDLALGVLAGAVSLFPLFGQSKRVNNFAQLQLQSTRVVEDVFKGLRGIVNPQQFNKPRHPVDIN